MSPLASVCNFGLFLLLLILMLRKPIQTFFHTRSEHMKQEVDQMQQLHNKAFLWLKDCEKRLAALQQEIAQLHQQALDQADMEKKKIAHQAQQMAQTIFTDAQRQAQRQSKTIQQQLEKEIMVAAIDKAKEQLSIIASQQVHDNFVQQLINRVQNDANAK